MIEFNRKLELLGILYKAKKINGEYFSEGFETCDVEEQQFLNTYLGLLLINHKTEGKIPLSKKEEELLILFFNFGRIKNNDIPRFIFRYDSFERARQTIQEKCIQMSSNSTFNDPFEGVLHADYASAKDADIVEFYMARKLPMAEFVNLINDLKDNKKRQLLVEGMKNNHIKNITAAGIFCCSEINDSIPMWSHYARSHSGVCLEYDILKDFRFFDFVNKVEYTEYYPTKVSLEDALNDFKNSLLKISLMTKADIWKNEKELRLIKLESADKKININPDCLKSIIFGMRCNSENKGKIINDMLEKGYDKNTEIQKAEKVENEYKIEIKKVGVLGDHIQELIK